MVNNCNFHDVGQKNENELGIYDMSGNVWEWCEDWWDDEDYYYDRSLRNNPVNLTSSSDRIMRGGCWGGDAVCCRVAFRYYDSPASSNDSLGFRIARSR